MVLTSAYAKYSRLCQYASYENIKISSRHAKSKSSSLCKTIYINSWKIPETFAIPNGLILKWNKPLWQIDDLFSWSSSCGLTCLYPNFKSSFEKCLAGSSDASISSITGKSRVYFFVILLSALKFTWNLFCYFSSPLKQLENHTGYRTSQLHLPASFRR